MPKIKLKKSVLAAIREEASKVARIEAKRAVKGAVQRERHALAKSARKARKTKDAEEE